LFSLIKYCLISTPLSDLFLLVVHHSGSFISCQEPTETRIRKFIARIRSIVKVKDEFCLKVDELIKYSRIPGHLHSATRENDHKALWLVEGFSIIIKKEQVMGVVSVWLCDNPDKPAEYDFVVREILYRFDNAWKIREISRRHKLPNEYITDIQRPPSSNVSIRKFFLDIYFDDFGTYRNVYHTLGGVYLQFGNMPFKLRKQLKNHFLLGFVPFGGDIYEFFAPLRDEIKLLERGIMISTNTGEYWVVGGVGCVTADLPQGNDLAGVKRHGANFGCRACFAHRERSTDNRFDYLTNARFSHLSDNQYAKAATLSTITARERYATEYGISLNPQPFEGLAWDRHIQTPHDAYHAMGGKTRRLLDETFNLLTSSGESEWLHHWKLIEKPPRWSKLPNPILHRQSFMFSDIFRLAMLMPFILRRFLTWRLMKKDLLESIQRRLNLPRIEQVPLKVIQVWVTEAKALKLVFSVTLSSNDFQALIKALKEQSRILLEVSSN